MMKLSSYYGSPYIGVYCVANESVSMVPPDAPEALIRDIREGMGVDVIRTMIAGTNILGAFVAMNSYGAVMTNMASSDETALMGEHLPVLRVKDRLNAYGNNILVNDNAALVNPELSKAAMKLIKDTLQVEVEQGTVAGHKTVGSVCVATNKGIVCHPSSTKEEMDLMRSLFKVPVSVGTLNYGAPVIGACLIANSKGAVIGFRSTPIELGRVEDALYF